jgi:hypothetical protein
MVEKFIFMVALVKVTVSAAVLIFHTSRRGIVNPFRRLGGAKALIGLARFRISGFNDAWINLRVARTRF